MNRDRRTASEDRHPASNPPLIQVQNLDLDIDTSRGRFRILRNVSFRLDAGACLGVVGESGCGKTLTVLSIMGLVDAMHGRVAGGRILFKGRDLLETGKKALNAVRGNEMAMIFQNPASALNPYLRISEQLVEGLIHHQGVPEKEALARGVELMSRVGIPAAERRIHDYPHQFSGGMLQRIMIAMALMTSPDLLIADEPTSALDVTIQAQTLELLDDMRRNTGTAVILITHDLGLVSGRSDRLAVMYAGSIVEYGETARVLASPAHPYLQALLASSTKKEGASEGRLFEIEGHPPQPGAFPVGCAFAPRCPHVMERCETRPPQLKEIESGHTVACYLHE